MQNAMELLKVGREWEENDGQYKKKGDIVPPLNDATT